VRESTIRSIHRIMNNPCVELVVGLIIAGVAIWTIFGLVELAENEGEARLRGDHGLLVLGIFLVVRSLALLFEGFEFIAEGTRGIVALCCNAVVASINKVAKHPLFELLTGMLLLAAGFIEAYEVLERGHFGEGGVAWFGMALLGLSMLAKALLGLLDALLVVEHSSSLSRPAWLEKLAHIFRHPRFEVLVAVVVIVTGVWEEFIVEATEADAALLQTNHTIILFGLIQLLKFAPHLFTSLEVIADADRAGRPH
jgi:hypothetical protein